MIVKYFLWLCFALKSACSTPLIRQVGESDQLMDNAQQLATARVEQHAKGFGDRIDLVWDILHRVTHLNISQLVDSQQCANDLRYFVEQSRRFNAVRDCKVANKTGCEDAELIKQETSWTRNVLDAMGKPGPGILNGNMYWLGDFAQCKQISASSINATFQGQYCLAEHTLEISVGDDRRSINRTQTDSGSVDLKRPITANVYYGVCFPASCSSAEINATINALIAVAVMLEKNMDEFEQDLDWSHGKPRLIEPLEKINWTSYEASKNGSAMFDAINCHTELQLSNDGGSVATTVFCCLVAFLAITSTVYDVLIAQNSFHLLAQPTAADEQPGECSETAKVPSTGSSQSVFTKIVLCFSFYTNTKRLLSTPKGESNLECVHGIRFLSMSWVILGHTYFYGSYYVDNQLFTARDILKYPSMQMVLNGTYSVDTFFTISGLLLTYLWLKTTKAMKGKNIKSLPHWLLYYTHRYIRLTPIYAVLLLLLVTLYRYLADGPIWDQHGVENVNCARSWWTNLLYLNNFVNMDYKCMGHTWFLANDMQYHVFAPILLLAFWKFEMAGIALSLALVVLSSALNGWYMVSRNLAANGFFTLDNHQFSTGTNQFFDNVYIKPYMRWNPYIVGMLTGLLLYKIGERKFRMPKALVCLLWLLAFVVNNLVIFGLYYYAKGHHMPVAANGFYSALSRLAWSLGVAWMLFACLTGNGGPVNKFLSWGVFVPLSRLTYCAYLIHPYVIERAYFSMAHPIHYDTRYTMVYFYLGHLCMSYLLSYFLSLAFESPMMGLENILLYKSRRHGNSQPSKQVEPADERAEEKASKQ